LTGTDFNDRFVTLRNGPIVPAAAYLLFLNFEQRGVQVRRDGDGLLVGPRELLEAADRVQIVRWKHHLLLLLDYCSRAGNDAHLFSDTAPLAPTKIA
jgi:hypothetical protein